jgi:alkanesulfonate monooxygenase SsuD/methylene tetrahydromethanopterin reductase-like flavin-dependent oxidoreductase (luciferase family)
LRSERLEEQLAIVTGLWATKMGDRFSYRGRHYTLIDAPALPKPPQQPVPIIIGGSGPRRTPVLAARYAAEFNLAFRPFEQFVAQRDRVRAACEAIDRDPATIGMSVGLTTACGSNEREVARRAAAVGRSVDDIGRGGIAGTPAQWVDRLHTYMDAGVQRAYLQILDLHDLDHLRLIAAEVLPRVA